MTEEEPKKSENAGEAGKVTQFNQSVFIKDV